MEKVVGAFILAALSPFLVVGGYLIALLVYLIIAIPFYFLWNWAAPIYFTFLPPVWIVLPFWHIVGLMWILSTVKTVILPSASATASTK